jgi:DNA-binding GntR family transcriptional regulator
MAPVKAIRARTLRDEAGRVIRAGIIAGELKAGEIYSANALAEKLGVSPTPVREALLDLANVGLVDPIRNRGFRVRVPDDRDLDEIGELRLMLEVPAMRKVVERASVDELQLLEPAVSEIENAAEAGDMSRYILADREFHLGLLELTGNARLVRLVGQLRDQTRVIGLAELAASGGLMASTREHREILRALQRRDGDAAEALMQAHIEHTRGIWAGRSEHAAVAG